MKVVFVVDSIDDLNAKVDMIKNRFGNEINFVVKANLVPLFNTFGYGIKAVYVKNLANVVHHLVDRIGVNDVVIYYASLTLTNELLNEFVNKIGNRDKVVNIIPKYNVWERMCNGIYNGYVKSLFKLNDSMATPKLQFLPEPFVYELLNTHFGNKLFAVNDELVTNIYVEDRKINKTAKIKTKFNKFHLIPIIVALAITALLFMCLGLLKSVNFVLVIAFVCLYLVDIILAIFYQLKIYFDTRFLR